MADRNLFWISTAQGARPTWRFYALAALGGAIFVGLIILAASLAVILLPVAVVLVLVLRYLARRQMKRAANAPTGQARKAGATVIEGDYEVVGEDKPDRRE